MVLAEVSLRLQYVTEDTECGCEPFTLIVTGAGQMRLTARLVSAPHVQTMTGQGLLDSPPWTKGPEPASIVPSSCTFLRPGEEAAGPH